MNQNRRLTDGALVAAAEQGRDEALALLLILSESRILPMNGKTVYVLLMAAQALADEVGIAIDVDKVVELNAEQEAQAERLKALSALRAIGFTPEELGNGAHVFLASPPPALPQGDGDYGDENDTFAQHRADDDGLSIPPQDDEQDDRPATRW